ncbi:MAG: hypothetical protein M3O73_07310 [Actinomycetota bacterium]|nr:hypothetical protein [Actinomycetota bacterium]
MIEAAQVGWRWASRSSTRPDGTAEAAAPNHKGVRASHSKSVWEAHACPQHTGFSYLASARPWSRWSQGAILKALVCSAVSGAATFGAANLPEAMAKRMQLRADVFAAEKKYVRQPL